MYDLAVIGGGPSGTAAGRLAGKYGLDTLLIEKEKFPRAKPCGGAFSNQAKSYLDFELPDRILEKNVFGARVHFKDKVIEEHKDYQIASIVTRKKLDNFLLQKAAESGINIHTGKKVKKCEKKQGYVDIYTPDNCYQARYVVIAEGAQGSLKKMIRENITPGEFGLCLVTEIEDSKQHIDEYIYNAIDIHFGLAEMGYGWIFPHEDHFSVGIGGLADKLSRPLEKMKSFLHNNGFSENTDIKRHLIPVGGLKRKITSGRMLLSGDAAGFVDSFYGEGIAYAIRSGQIAVEVIKELLDNKTASGNLEEYKKRCEQEFADNLKYSLWLSRLMHRYPNIFIKLLSSNREVINTYLEVPALKRSYKNFLGWLVPRLPKFLLMDSRIGHYFARSD